MYDIYQLTEKIGISRSTIYQWIRQYAQYLTPDPMAQQRRGGSMAMARQYTDHDLRVLLYVKELRKRNWNQREISAELDRRLTGKNAQTPITSQLPALIDTQATAIPAQPEAPKAPQETPQAPGMYDQAIMAAMFPKYGHSAPSAPAVPPATVEPVVIDPPIKVDPPAQSGFVAADSKKPVTYSSIPRVDPLPAKPADDQPIITYTRIPVEQPEPAAPFPDDETLIKWLQKERGNLCEIAWQLGNLDEQQLWQHVTRSKTLRPIYLAARGWGGGVGVGDLRQANFG